MKKDSNKIAKILIRCLIGECILLAIVVIGYVGIRLHQKDKVNAGSDPNQDALTQVVDQKKDTNGDGSSGSEVSNSEAYKENVETGNGNSLISQEEKEKKEQEEQRAEEKKQLLENANTLALGYDYESAIELITSYEANYEQDEELKEAVATYQESIANLSLYGSYESIDEISHVFFHSLIVDTSKAFDLDRMSNGYNYWMTTVDEFNRMMEQMYEDGYVLVSIHDVAHEEIQEDGSVKMVPGEILLPEGKKPFVLSQDDVNFYEYMQTDGFARRIVIDENGYPACEMELNGKTVVARDYDVVPLLEKFIEEHPDFAYRGARGIIGVTGYEGVMGYRTNEKDSATYEADVKQATEVANRLKELGWEFASHSYGHGHMGQESAAYVKRDSEHWDQDVAPIVGKTDIYLFPYGEDIQEGVGKYAGEKYETLSGLGFKYFCGVYAYPWIQVNDQYVRMTRRNLDGYTMHFYPQRLEDLFDVAATIDAARPEFK